VTILLPKGIVWVRRITERSAAMTDLEIVTLYWERNENAIVETKRGYGAYCRRIAQNILTNLQDVDECESDTYLTAWNTMPPQKPDTLAPYLGRITRNLSLKRLRWNQAQKRGGGKGELSLDELAECIPAGKTFQEALDARELARIIDRFLRALPAEARWIFLRRYWYCDPVETIAKQLGCGQSRVKMSLYRTRNKLRDTLEKEGIFVER
jgi:RNA polymerase sigma-70 factor (ECF subfamily)